MPKLFHLENQDNALHASLNYGSSLSLTRAVVERAHPPSNVEWDGRKDNITVFIDNLKCEDAQRNEIKDIYATGREVRISYTSQDSSRQAAAQYAQQHGLDLASRAQLEGRWKHQWGTRWGVKGSGKRRELLQCGCGYNTEARQREAERTPGNGSPAKVAWIRTAPYDWTGCLAHADVTYDESSGAVCRIVGWLEHNDACKNAPMKRMPAIPLHPHVVEVALGQLAEGASVAAIQARNLEMHTRQGYRDQLGIDLLVANHRYELLPSDFRSLYRQHHRANGINVRKQPEVNVHEWLTPRSGNFREIVANAVFHYAPRIKETDRFKLCICTSEMEEAAWKYVHQSQLMLDGTFGLSSVRLLVWIAMGVDLDNKGVPVAIMLFSAPTGSKATHAGYNTAIITEIIQAWKSWMSGRPSAKGRTFEPAVAITDTDTKERGALLTVWPSIILLLCRFHVRQCWTNKRGSLVGKAGTPNTTYWKVHTLARLRTLEEVLLQSTVHDHAVTLVHAERLHFESLSLDPPSRDTSKSALAYLDYLQSTWIPYALWRSWSSCGRMEAAVRLGISVEGVLPTTNHLESFNGVLKHKYVAQWQHSHHRLWFDILIHHLIHYILPRLFAMLRLYVHYRDWKSQRFQAAAGGALLLRSHEGRKKQEHRPVAWLEANDTRDVMAIDIISCRRLMVIPSLRHFEMWATCATSLARVDDPAYPRYWLSIHSTGAATCTCADWLQRGGACKHIRAFVLYTRLQMQSSPSGAQLGYQLPVTQESALELAAKNQAWYGATYAAVFTQSVAISSYKQGYFGTNPPPTMQVADVVASLAQPSCIPPPPDRAFEMPSLETEDELEKLAEHEEGPIEETVAILEGPHPLTQPDRRRGSDHAAVALQIQQRVDHEIDQLLPRLHGLATLISDATSLKVTSKIVELQGLLEQLSGDVGLRCSLVGQDGLAAEPLTMTLQAMTPPQIADRHVSGELSRSTTTTDSSSSRKRLRTDKNVQLRPPSPEKKQKRIASRSGL